MTALVLEPGGMLMQYRLVAPIGSGGMGDVWKAVDTRLNRDVAIKFIDAEHVADPERRRRLLREAQLASALNHPNTVTIYDVHSGDPVDFIAMEYIPGVTLRQLLQAGRIALKLAVDYAIQIADGIAAAHANGIVHRDIKPGNIMLGDDGRVRVLDFGLARIAEAGSGDVPDLHDSSLTKPGVALGTPAYMSPEQALAEPVDARSDVFSFGIVLYEMLAGVSPFHASDRARTFRKLLHDCPPPLADFVPGVPSAIEAVARTCLEKDPARRYPDCAAVAAALRDAGSRLSAVSHAPTVSLAAEPDSHSEKIGGPVAPRRRKLLLAAATLAAAIALGGVLWLRSIPAPAPQQRGVAVLPFTNVGGDSRSLAFGLGLVMAVSTSIVNAEELQNAFWIVSPGDVLQAHIQSAHEARQLFGVDLAVTGSIEVSGDNVRVIASLTDTHTQHQIGSRTITRPAGDSLKLEDDLADAVASMLPASPADRPKAIRSAGSGVPGAQDYYLRGRGYLQTDELSAGARADNAIAEFQEALRRDPKFAAARAGLAAAELAQFHATKETAWIVRAEADAAEALRLGGRTVEALTSLAAVSRAEGRYAESASLLEEARGHDPRNAEVWKALAQTYEALKRIRRRPKRPTSARFRFNRATLPPTRIWASSCISRAATQRPSAASSKPASSRPIATRRGYASAPSTRRPAEPRLPKRPTNIPLSLKPNAFSYNNLSALYFDQERYAEAIPYEEKAVEMGAVNLTMLSNLARAYRRVPEQANKSGPVVERALALAGRMLDVNPRDAATHAELALLLAETSDRARAAREIDDALSLAPDDTAVLFRAVLTYEALGRRDDALRAWRELAKTGSQTKEIGKRPELKALRADPRFKGEK